MEIKTEAVSQLEYNSLREPLIIPEYGRHLQKLIDQITEIQDKEERNKAAKYVISVMGSLNPHLRDVPDFQHKLWDQLFIMSDFKLDVDSPYPIPSREALNQRPEILQYPQNFPKYRFYGNNITYMIDVAIKWEEGDLKSALILVIANHMKKCYLSWNKETVEDEVIFQHLLELSDGKINLFKSNEELSNSHNLMKVNKKVSNKSQFNSGNKSTNSKNHKKKTNNNPKNHKRN
ncbi:DUF4290 domain-containing protein [Flavobacterium sp. J27]|uniref:DUF4290 domain-containing protein n=1 Tax=Flavobacterium sp. J27 TaxID=2060419 RepID=UPI001030D676|nr:DUF4290 domain-containing protein [Flavobacterium sp. J27]